MKKLFQAIRSSDFDTVKQLLDKKPELISCTAKQPPKKDDGQSPLQVALKTGNFEIANYLLDLGADVNAKDSYGVSCMWRFCSQARQILPTYNHVQQKLLEDRIFTSELKDDLSRIFYILLENGMDLEYIAPSFSCSAKEMYGEEPVGYFLK